MSRTFFGQRKIAISDDANKIYVISGFREGHENPMPNLIQVDLTLSTARLLFVL